MGTVNGKGYELEEESLRIWGHTAKPVNQESDDDGYGQSRRDLFRLVVLCVCLTNCKAAAARENTGRRK